MYYATAGPQRAEGPCVTCGLNYTDALPLHRYLCPGHFGYVQLPVPVFNPLLFSEMFSVCIRCLDHILTDTFSAQYAIVGMPRNAFNDEPCTLVCQMFFNGF